MNSLLVFHGVVSLLVVLKNDELRMRIIMQDILEEQTAKSIDT